MIRQNITLEDIARTLKINRETARRKVKGDIGFSLPQCQKIALLFVSNNTLDYLFKRG